MSGLGPPQNLGTWYRYQETHYRYWDPEQECHVGPVTTSVKLYQFPVLKITPKGARLADGRFVLKNANKRYACPTKEEAMVSFLARKEKQLKILQNQITNVQSAIYVAKNLKGEAP